MKKMYPGLDALPVSERKKILEDNAYETGFSDVRRNFTAEEIAEMKTNLSDETILKRDAEKELKALSAPLTAQIKAKTKAINAISDHLRNGYYDRNENVFYMADHIEGMIHCYDGEGFLLHSRPMNDRERQHKLKIA